jgi:hypothetical protein
VENTLFYKYKTILVLSFFLVFSYCYAAETQKKIGGITNIEAFISIPKEAIDISDKNEDILVEFVIKNNSDDFIRFLSWNTPLDKILSKGVFDIKQGDKKVEYSGRMVKRGNPLDKDYFTLEPKESFSKTINLRDAYNFIDSGRYIITLQPISVKLKNSVGNFKSVTLLKNTVELNIL